MNKIAPRLGSFVAVFAAIVLSCCQTDVARAQSPQTELKPFAIKVGGFFPGDTDARDAGGSTLFLLEADYRLADVVETSSLSYSKLSIGYIERGDLRMYPITLSQEFRDPNVAVNTGFYFGAGFGFYLTRLDAPGTSGDTKNLVGGFIVGGLDFGGNLFTEAKYHIVSEYENRKVNGFQLAIGVRF